MKLKISGVAALFVALGAVPAFAQTDPAREAVVQAFLQFDCLITRENEDAVLAATGLAEADAEAAAAGMFAEGMFEEREDSLLLLHPECPNGASAPEPSGIQAAIAWMSDLEPNRAADVLAEALTARGCSIRNDEFDFFEQEVAALVADRFGFEVPPLGHPEHVPLFEALDDMGELGGETLFARGAIESDGQLNTLVGCEAPVGAPIREVELMDRLSSLTPEAVAAIEAEALADVTCQFPADMGYNFSAMVFDRVMAAVDFDLGPAGALAVMGPSRIGQFYSGEYETAFTFGSGLVNDTVNGMVRDGRLEQRGRMMVGTACEPTAQRPDALLPYLTGGQ